MSSPGLAGRGPATHGFGPWRGRVLGPCALGPGLRVGRPDGQPRGVRLTAGGGTASHAWGRGSGPSGPDPVSSPGLAGRRPATRGFGPWRGRVLGPCALPSRGRPAVAWLPGALPWSPGPEWPEVRGAPPDSRPSPCGRPAPARLPEAGTRPPPGSPGLPGGTAQAPPGSLDCPAALPRPRSAKAGVGQAGRAVCRGHQRVRGRRPARARRRLGRPRPGRPRRSAVDTKERAFGPGGMTGPRGQGRAGAGRAPAAGGVSRS
ncbi:hypothetical protein QO019_006461 [Streptomyces thermodiastaticus]|uniref:Uncharacterized protein n=1 Tax=Streptomyces thermodiastaticus TaxID=44061 RepID=A0ABU0KQ43_9ACTN|nr:hypothetical protein [Streptomyces thermodiastaticus]